MCCLEDLPRTWTVEKQISFINTDSIIQFNINRSLFDDITIDTTTLMGFNILKLYWKFLPNSKFIHRAFEVASIRHFPSSHPTHLLFF